MATLPPPTWAPLAQVGAQATAQELQAVRDHAASNRGVRLVRPDWLRLCHHERRLVAPDARCSISVEQTLARSISAAQAAAGQLHSAGSSGPFAALVSSSSLAAGPGGRQQGTGGPEFWRDQPADPKQPLAGCWFTLAAVRGSRDEAAMAAQIKWGPRRSLPAARCPILAAARCPAAPSCYPTCQSIMSRLSSASPSRPSSCKAL